MLFQVSLFIHDPLRTNNLGILKASFKSLNRFAAIINAGLEVRDSFIELGYGGPKIGA
jgi:hypothetical protein